MKSFVVRLVGMLAVTLILGAAGPVLAAPKKPKPAKTPAPTPTVSVTDQLEAARTATKSLPALAIDATLRRATFEIHLQVKRVGVDWELKLAGKESMWEIHKGGNDYASTDEGKTWRPTKPDDDFVTAVMAPLENGQLVGNPPHRPIYETVGTETVNGEQLLHLRLVPDKGDKVDADGLPEEWLVSDGHGGWLLRRTKSPVTLFKNRVDAEIRYEALPEDAKVDGPENVAPAAGAPAKP